MKLRVSQSPGQSDTGQHYYKESYTTMAVSRRAPSPRGSAPQSRSGVVAVVVGSGGAGRAATSWSSSSVMRVPATMQRQVPAL